MQTCNCINTYRYKSECVVCGAEWPQPERQFTMVKFKDVPLGGRIVSQFTDTVWVVLETHGRGLIASESLEPGSRQSLCCFTDPDEGITLDTEVEFLGLQPLPTK